jgi:hypothetical protein
MTKRFFAFGCSSTRYAWPTWADILGLDFDVYQNWGYSGAGNHYILYTLIEAIQRNQISSEDTVGIMFTNVGREDRYIKGSWLVTGGVYNTSVLDEKYIENLTDPDGFLITNVAVIDAVVKILKGIGCKFFLMSTVPIHVVDDSFLKKIFFLNDKVQTQISKLYKDSLELIKPSLLEIVWNGDITSQNHIIIPKARTAATEKLKTRYVECAGKDWPTFDNFMSNELDNVDASILTELDKQFDFVSWRDRILHQRQDTHATPQEHLRYLDTVGFELSAEQKDFAEQWQTKILTTEDFHYSSGEFPRF